VESKSSERDVANVTGGQTSRKGRGAGICTVWWREAQAPA